MFRAAVAKLSRLTKPTIIIVIALVLFVSQLGYATYYFTSSARSAPGDGKMILFFDGATTPTGWTCVSCSSGDPFYQTFPRGNDTYGGAGGTANHSHTASVSAATSATTATENRAGTVLSGSTHTHGGSITVANASNLPQYRQLKMIRYDTAGEPATLPVGVIGLFDTTLPSGWASYASQNSYYAYGENTAGTAGGNNNHTHGLSGTLSADTGTSYGSRKGGSQVAAANFGHTHTFSGTSTSASNEPPYIEVIFGKLSTATSPPNDLIAMWDDDEPGNWTKQSGSTGAFNQKFIKGSASYGSTGGSATNTHAQTIVTSSVTAGTTTGRSGNATTLGSHTHQTTVNSYSTDNHLPPYRDVIMAKRIPQSSFEQSGYRLFNNLDSTDVGTTLAALNTAATAPPQGDKFRLRMLVHVSDANAGISSKNFKLQYSSRSGTCDTSFTGETYADVQAGSGAIRFANNASASDGASLTTNANDPTHGSDTVTAQTYEEANNFTIASVINSGRDGLWDFALMDDSASAQASYCFRVVQSDGTALDTYSQIPEIITDDGNGHMVVFYDGASAPSGWTCVSCANTDPYYQKFIKGAASYGSTGGSANHDHTVSTSHTSSGSNPTESQGGSGIAISTHTHNISETIGLSANLPPYRNLLVLRSNNSGVPSTLPAGTITMFDAAVPSGWTRYGAQDGHYIRGEATAGGTGGGLTHSHSLSATLDGAIGGTSARTNGAQASTALEAHTHSTSGTSDTVNHEPQYREMIIGKSNSAAAAPVNIITYWDNPPPSAWTKVSTSGQPLYQNYTKPATTYGATGGNANHNHADAIVTSGAPSQTANHRTGAGGAGGTHTHNVSFASFSNAINDPPYIEAIAAKQGAINNPPNNPATLKQYRTSDSTEITIGEYSNDGQVKFEAQATDADNPDDLQLCVEVKPVGTAFTNTVTKCGTIVSYSGTAVTVDVTVTGLTDTENYHWQAAIKDSGGALSSWVSFGGNAESATDFIDDSSDPTGTVYDGVSVGVDVDFNGGSLSQLDANWNITDTGSGIDYYDYSIGTTPGGTDTKAWTSIGTSTSQNVTGLTLGTAEVYYFNVRTYDNAGNNVVISSDGQMITPSLTFSISDATITFNNLNAGNNFTDSSVITLSTTTNARNGYEVRAYAPQLASAGGDNIGIFDGGTYNSTDAWQSGDYGYGYTSSDAFVNGSNRFLPVICPGGGAPPCYAPFAVGSPGDIVADNTSTTTGAPITNEQFDITHRVTTQSSQEAGTYRTTVVYSAAAKY